MEIGSALAVLASAEITKPMLERLLGPTVDYLGAGLHDLTQKRVENIARIITKANRKAEQENAAASGLVPPRLIKNIFDDGSFTEDELTAEYLAGVLASSKSPNGRDDRGVALSSLVNRLAMYSLRTHYIVYTATRALLLGSDVNLGLGQQVTEQARIYLPISTYAAAMDYEETEHGYGATSHALYALSREQLIDDNFCLGSLQLMREEAPQAWEEGIIFAPSIPGVELYLWAHGKAKFDQWSRALLDPQEDFASELDFHLEQDFALVSALQAPQGSA
jgi:hypothetical protein